MPFPQNCTPADADQDRLDFSLHGHVDAPDFIAWMQKHATKLGVTFCVAQHSAKHLSLHAEGPSEMLHAFALACSLGPKSVTIDWLELPETGPD